MLCDFVNVLKAGLNTLKTNVLIFVVSTKCYINLLKYIQNLKKINKRTSTFYLEVLNHRGKNLIILMA